MMTLTARSVIKNKYWIVEQNGEQVATIQASPDGVAFVRKSEEREHFVSIKLLKSKYNITFAKEKKPKRTSEVSFDVYGFPCDNKPYNMLIHLTKKIPVYAKTKRSKSFFCAGYYLVSDGNTFTLAYCPKLITLNRYNFYGPFHTKTAAKVYEKALKSAQV